VEWSSLYGNRFQSDCACSSALNYARTVDANGVCIGGITSNGTASNTTANPGNLDMCVILQAYRVLVPNHVTALMQFQPNVYSVQVSFTVPKGEVIQYVSTSCPTAFHILKPNGASGNTEVVFLTNETTPQQITIQITQFNISFLCPSPAPLTLSYSATRPAIYANIPPCGVQYVNVYPYLSNAACYPYPGLEMYAASSSSTAPPVSSGTVAYVSEVIDANVEALYQLTVELSALQTQMFNIPFAATNQEQAVKMAGSVLEQQQKSLSRINSSSISETLSKSSYQEAFSKISNGSQQISQNIAKQEELAKQANNNSAMLQMVVQQVAEATYKSNQTVEQGVKSEEYTKNFIDEQKAKIQNELSSSGGDSCSISWIPLIGDALCSLWSDITGVFQLVIEIVVVIIAVCLIALCINSGCCQVFCKCCCRMCSIHHKAFKHHYDSEDEDDVEPDNHVVKRAPTKSSSTTTVQAAYHPVPVRTFDIG